MTILFQFAGRSDPQISVTSQDGGGSNPHRGSNSSSHSPSSQTRAKHSSASSSTENHGQVGKPPRSPLGHGGLVRGSKQDGQPSASSGSHGNVSSTSTQNHIGPVRYLLLRCWHQSLSGQPCFPSLKVPLSSQLRSSEKTTSYRRTSSGGGNQGKSSTPPSSAGSQEELYCSLVASNPGPNQAPPLTPSPSTSPTLICVPRSRKNAMVTDETAGPRRFVNEKNNMDKHPTASPFQVSGSRPHQKRVKALVDCRAVASEQLAFFKDEIIVVTASSDPHWWVSGITLPPFFLFL